PPPDIHIDKWVESIELIRERKAKAIYLTHYGAVTQIEPHLDQLKENIEQLANWVKEHLDAGESIEEMTPKFDEYCIEELKKLELSEVEINQYQAANPAWMSVAGLARYWKKKAEGKL
ncbi:MAG: MBL fold metallo-hydrolase, partial [Bacteroidota bacterium]